MNCIPKALLGLALVLAALSHAEESKVRERVVPPSKTSMDFFDHLEGPARWQFGGKAVLSLRMWGGSTIFLLNDDQESFRLNAPEYVQAAVLSEDGKTLVLVVMKSSGFGSDFAALLRVQPDGNHVKVARVLESGQKLFDGRRWWLSELGAVSNDGAKILAKFGIDVPDSHRMVYRWHTVELAPCRILGEGLTIENGKKPPGIR